MMRGLVLRGSRYDGTRRTDRPPTGVCSAKLVWVPIFLVGSLLINACERATSTPSELLEEHERRIHEGLDAFGREFDASTAWVPDDETGAYELFTIQSWDDRALYTADLQGAFTDTPRVALLAIVTDIIRLEHGYRITLAFQEPPMIVFMLLASEKQGSLLLRERPQLWESVFVAATIDRVSRPIFRASAPAYTDYAELEFDVMPPFVAHGSLLGLRLTPSK